MKTAFAAVSAVSATSLASTRGLPAMLLTRDWRALGTGVRLVVQGGDADAAREAVEAVEVAQDGRVVLVAGWPEPVPGIGPGDAPAARGGTHNA